MFAKILLIVMVSSLLTTTNSIDCDNGFFELENETGNRVCEKCPEGCLTCFTYKINWKQGDPLMCGECF
jgi:hypothetical protein